MRTKTIKYGNYTSTPKKSFFFLFFKGWVGVKQFWVKIAYSFCLSSSSAYTPQDLRALVVLEFGVGVVMVLSSFAPVPPFPLPFDAQASSPS